jgi:type II restriction enzyme
MQKIQFREFMENLVETINSYDFFVDWEKVGINVKKIEKRLNILNYLIGKENLEKEFYELLNEYPEVVTVFPILLAIRDEKQSILTENLELMKYKFENETLSEDKIKLYYEFFKKTGLEALVKDKKVKNLVDYVFGVEVGMDTNARKNRTGTQMENLVENYIKKICGDCSEMDYIRYANKKKVFEKWRYEIEIDKTNRVFDFAIYNKKIGKLFLIEVNFYGGGGSKLKSTAGEYQYLNDFLNKQNINLIWITDGFGWKTARKPLEETYIHNNYILNIKLLKEDKLKEIVNGVKI